MRLDEVKILVTGANGFVGTHLMKVGELRKHVMVALTRSDCDFEVGPRRVSASFSRLVETHQPGAVIHLAGPPPTANAELCERMCIEGTMGLLAALERYQDIRLVAAGSATEVGTFPRARGCVDESIECYPASPYGKAKLEQSKMVIESGGVAIRLFNSTGPGQSANVVAGRIIHQLATNQPKLVIRETRSIRDFLDVRDAVSAFLLAAETLPTGRYNVCSGRPVSIGTLIELACELAGVPDLEIEVEEPDYEADFICGDPSLIESHGWTRKYDLRETLQDFLEWATNLHRQSR